MPIYKTEQKTFDLIKRILWIVQDDFCRVLAKVYKDGIAFIKTK